MSRVTELEKALTTLFRKGTEVGYTETEIDEFLENIDYHALLQAVWNKAETVYAYLRRARVLVVCGSIVDESVKNDIAVAERLRITATTLDGILTVKGQGRRNE